VDLNRELLIKTQETGFSGVSALDIYHTTALFYILILYKFKRIRSLSSTIINIVGETDDGNF
jgi:hypothetical protein